MMPYSSQYNDTSSLDVSPTNTIFLLVMAAFTVFGNAIVLLTLYKDPAKELRTVSNFLIANLATSDLILGLIAEPLFASNHWLHHRVVYRVSRYVVDVFLIASFLSILALSFERYYMLKTAGLVESGFQKYHAMASAVGIWILATLLPIEVFFLKEKDSKMLVAFGIGCPVGLVMIGLYIKIYLVIKRVYRKDRGMVLNEQAGLIRDSENSKRAERIRARELQLARAIFTVVGVFVLFWIPAIVSDTLGKVCHKTSSCHLTKNLSDLMVFTGFLNAAFNPIVYSLTNKKFRKAFILMLIPKTADSESLKPLIVV